ncbi:uncharacterized protein LOC135232749, partial [Loxodonta africana]|uniref:uncharacterized protein LOC135232749 n=1 Tax=Loxodonta africana TaxID=9785 RepID=UPI0030D2F5D6
RAVRAPGSVRLSGPPAKGCPPPSPREVGSLSCGGGSQLLHIWLLLHIYILERASERGGRAGGREEGGGRGGEREEEEERAEYTADIISTTVAEPYRTCFTAGGSKTSPVEQQPEHQQPQDIVSLPLPPLPHATPDSFTLYTTYCVFLFGLPLVHFLGHRSSIVWQVTKVVHSRCRLLGHPCTAASSCVTATGKCIAYQVTESAGGHLFLPQDLHQKSSGLGGIFGVQSIYELARRHNASPFYFGPP